MEMEILFFFLTRRGSEFGNGIDLLLLFLRFLLLHEGESSEADVRARVQPRAGNRIEHGQRVKSSGT